MAITLRDEVIPKAIFDYDLIETSNDRIQVFTFSTTPSRGGAVGGEIVKCHREPDF